MLIFQGKNSISGIVVKKDKRKTQVRCVDGTVDWYINDSVKKIQDTKWDHRIKKAVKESFAEN